MEPSAACVLVIFGASGDLTRRKLVPALYDLHRQKLLSHRFSLLGVGRTRLNDELFRSSVIEAVNAFAETRPVDQSELTMFAKLAHYETLDIDSPDEYRKLSTRLDELATEHDVPGNVMYYLAIPPTGYETVARNLGLADLNHEASGTAWRRIIVEKPFGQDLESARVLNERLHGVFGEHQIYRIDHYLGKETVQNIFALRFSNGIFEPLWNRNYVDRVEITAAEHLGVANRARYYEQAGALRDMVQNHLLQILGIIAMEPPSVFQSDAVRDEAVKVLKALRPIPVDEAEQYVVRGQYMSSTVAGVRVPGYRDEPGVASDSRAETFVALKAYVDNWRWGGVPFYIRTGKRLPTRVTEVVIYFKRTPHLIFARHGLNSVDCNQLVIRIQPDEGILIKIGMKVPGAGFEIQNANMDFHYSDLGDTRIASAYERLLLDAMNGDSTLYARSDAVETAWAFVQPIQQAWQSNRAIKMYGYPAGTWGPLEANLLFGDVKQDWRYPCKNLTNDGLYCEL